MTSSRFRLRVQQIARLRVAGVSDTRICQIFNLSPNGLHRIIHTPDYQDEENCVLNGTVTKLDEALAGRTNLIKQEFKVGVPAACRALLETVTQKRDLRARLAAAAEILDRDPDRTLMKQKDIDSDAQRDAALTEAELAAAGQVAETAASEANKAAQTAQTKPN